MPKKKTFLRPGDIVRQGRQRVDLRVLQANGDRAVLVETVNNEAGEYLTFYAPASDLKRSSKADPDEPIVVEADPSADVEVDE